MELYSPEISNAHQNDEQMLVVLLATSIIEDISELCSQMAMINRGESLFEAEFRRAVEECHHEPAVR